MDAPLRFAIYKSIMKHVTESKNVDKDAFDAALAEKGKDADLKFIVSKLQ